jgi:hypothetical protein
MTRFKEGRRIESALKHRDASELSWAESYCRMRISIARREDHLKHWQTVLRKVIGALEAVR